MRGSVIFVGFIFLLAAIVANAFLPPLIVAGSGGQSATVGNLVGYVTNTSSGLGIVGASVVLSVSGTQKYSTSTTTAGYYKFAAIASGGYTITASAPGYQTFQGATGVSPGTTATFNVQLAPLSYAGYSGGSGCTPTPTGSGCSVPPPPPGVPAPPPILTNQTVYNQTLPSPLKQIPVLGGLGTVAFSLVSIGIVLIAVGVFMRRR